MTINPSARTANFHYAIRNIVSAAEALERKGRRVIHLNIGDPQAFGFRPPAHLIEAVARALSEKFTGYAHSAGLFQAREAVAAYATNLGSQTSPDDVIITSGASEAADLVLTALLDPGDQVLMPAPGYPLYTAILNKLGAEEVSYKLDQADGWRPSPNEVRAAITARTRAIILINPNNPTGAITPDETTRELLEIAARHNLLVISDEVYRELCFGPQPAPASLIAREIGAPVITLDSLSKTHLIPGWRVGWMRFTNSEQMPELIRAITRLASGRLCSPTVTQYAVQPALEGDRAFLDDFISEIRKRRDLAVSHVRQISGLSCAEPEAAFYLMVKAEKAGEQSDEQFVLDLLEATGVLVVHGSGFGADSRDNYFRMVYLAGEETLDTAFSRIEAFIASKSRSATLEQ
ncbi:MAG TPA: aminotransferase class I/II-fold pyridoxal phosphate-dependent enzyme [Blastocatellia bacterium]|nr:aminotransferase class I/II-fold pyridoxal phosphate-dependent enzyme [Blastocatellia bacterium]